MADIKEWAEQFAMHTWERLGFVYYNQHARLHETTITDELVYQFSHNFSEHEGMYTLKHAHNEKRNGNDIEIVVGYEGKYLKLPIQAKRMYANNRYPRFSHKGQLEGLLAYAKEIGGIPLYLLYNYLHDRFDHPKQLFGKELTKKQYGCTLVKADHISANYAFAQKRKDKDVWRIPKFENLHPNNAFPWHLLFYNPEEFISHTDEKGSTTDLAFPIRYYKEEEILEERNWQLITKPSSQNTGLVVSSGFLSSPSDVEGDTNTFAPRFRLVIKV